MNFLNAIFLLKHACVMEFKAFTTNILKCVVGHDPKIILLTFLKK